MMVSFQHKMDTTMFVYNYQIDEWGMCIDNEHSAMPAPFNSRSLFGDHIMNILSSLFQ